jgi:hypothetical protein
VCVCDCVRGRGRVEEEVSLTRLVPLGHSRSLTMRAIVLAALQTSSVFLAVAVVLFALMVINIVNDAAGNGEPPA